MSEGILGSIPNFMTAPRFNIIETWCNFAYMIQRIQRLVKILSEILFVWNTKMYPKIFSPRFIVRSFIRRKCSYLMDIICLSLYILGKIFFDLIFDLLFLCYVMFILCFFDPIFVSLIKFWFLSISILIIHLECITS